MEKNLKVFTIYGHGSHVGHMTRIVEEVSVLLIPGGYVCNLVTTGPVVSDVKLFEDDDGQRSLSILQAPKKLWPKRV